MGPPLHPQPPTPHEGAGVISVSPSSAKRGLEGKTVSPVKSNAANSMNNLKKENNVALLIIRHLLFRNYGLNTVGGRAEWEAGEMNPFFDCVSDHTNKANPNKVRF